MTLRIVRTPRARLDLVEIWGFIAQDSEAAADRLFDRISNILMMLADNPRAGRERADLHADIRSFPAGNYVLFYRVLDDAIELVRVRSRYLDTEPDSFG